MNLEIITILIEEESVKAFFVYLLLVLVLLLLIFLQFSKSELHREYLSRIIGGFAVFIFAVISNNHYVMFASLFVGGLVIASEDFMKNLAIILRSNSGDMANNLGMTATRASTQEVEKNKELEAATCENLAVKENINNEQDTINNTKNDWLKRRETTKVAEEKIFNFLNTRFGNRFQREVKINNEYGNVIVDGVVYDRCGLDEIELIVEIIYLHDANLNNIRTSMSIRRVLEKIRYLYIKKPILIVIVSELLNDDLAMKISERNKSNDVKFWYFNFSENKLTQLGSSQLI